MRRTLRLIPMLVFVVIAGAHLESGAADNVRLTLIEYAPLMGAHVKGYGIEPAIVTAACRQVGLDVEYDVFSPAGSIKLAKEGGYDGIVGLVWSEEREQSFYYSEPIFEAPLQLFHLKEFAFDWETMDDLKGIPIGITAKNYYGSAFQEALDTGNLTTDVANKDIIQFEKLLRHRIKLFPMNMFTGYYMINEQYDPQTAALFTHHPRPLKVSIYHVLFSRAVEENAARLELFNQGLQQLRASGEYDRIIEEYKREYMLE